MVRASFNISFVGIFLQWTKVMFWSSFYCLWWVILLWSCILFYLYFLVPYASQAILHEYLGVMLAVNNAFSDRSSALLTVQTLLSDLSSLNSQIEKLGAASSKIFGWDRSRIRKIEELKDTVRVTEDAKSCAIREYERIKVRQ